jgi:hypothetical protein
MTDTAFRFVTTNDTARMSIQDAADYLSVEPRHLARWIDRGLLGVAETDGTITVPATSVAQLYAGRRGDITARQAFDDLCARHELAGRLEELARGDASPINVDDTASLFGA